MDIQAAKIGALASGAYSISPRTGATMTISGCEFNKVIVDEASNLIVMFKDKQTHNYDYKTHIDRLNTETIFS